MIYRFTYRHDDTHQERSIDAPSMNAARRGLRLSSKWGCWECRSADGEPIWHMTESGDVVLGERPQGQDA